MELNCQLSAIRDKTRADWIQEEEERVVDVVVVGCEEVGKMESGDVKMNKRSAQGYDSMYPPMQPVNGYDCQQPPPPPPCQQQYAHTHYAQRTVIVGAPQGGNMGNRPRTTICYTCGEKVQTQVEYNCCNAYNWVICIFTGLCCVFIPKLCDYGTNTAVHSCPNCGAYIGDNGHC